MFSHAVLAAVIGLLWLPRPGAAQEPVWRETFRDPGFRGGFRTLSPAPGKRVPLGELRPPGAADGPHWDLAQWHSRFDISDAAAQETLGGGHAWVNPGKRVVIAPAPTEEADLVLGVDAIAEYGGRLREAGEPWPHLLAGQRFEPLVSVADTQAAVFTVAARLRESRAQEEVTLVAMRHAAQFLAFITVQNRNRASAGYGDFLWFGIPLYDSRWRIPRAFQAPDQAHAKFIFTPPGETYASESLHDGAWVRISTDLMPLIRDALRAAWERGYLKDSRDEADYFLAAFSIGWEMPGPFEAAVQVRDLSLQTLPRDTAQRPARPEPQ